MSERIRGVWCATLTPLDAKGDLAARTLAAHAQRMFAAGVDGIALFGTTGEGQSFSVAQRRAGLDALLAAGVPAKRVVVGTGCAALADAIELTRHAVATGCVGQLVLPPFFFTGLGDEGIYSFYARLIDGVGDARFRLYLYHIPQMSGVAIPHDVISRLATTHPGVLAGVKDSAGNLQHTRTLLERFRTLSIFVGHEPHLPAALAAGGAGTICGVANLYPKLIRRLYDTPASRGGEDLARIEAFVALLDRVPVFAAFKAVLAQLTGDATWESMAPPLVPMDRDAQRAFVASISRTGIVAARDAA